MKENEMPKIGEYLKDLSINTKVKKAFTLKLKNTNISFDYYVLDYSMICRKDGDNYMLCGWCFNDQSSAVGGWIECIQFLSPMYEVIQH